MPGNVLDRVNKTDVVPVPTDPEPGSCTHCDR